MTSALVLDYILKVVGVVSLTTIAFYAGNISRKVESLVEIVKDHEIRLRDIEKKK